MKPAEKLKRIKLISEKLYSENYTQGLHPNDCIVAAIFFVNEFEKFEDQFLKDNPVNGSRPESLQSSGHHDD